MRCAPAAPPDAGGDASSDGDAMADWIRNAGRILVMGDSITVGYYGLVGGWRAGLTSALSTAGVAHATVGPYSDAYGNHRGVSGICAYQQTSSVQTDCETYKPSIIVSASGANDIGGGATAAQTIAELGEIIDWCRAGAPHAMIELQTVIVPQNNGIPSYYDRRDIFSELNGLLPALCVTYGVSLIDVGAPDTTDGLHPSSTGYASMATAISSALLARIPGA